MGNQQLDPGPDSSQRHPGHSWLGTGEQKEAWKNGDLGTPFSKLPDSQGLAWAFTRAAIQRWAGHALPPTGPVPMAAHTSQRVVGIEPQSEVSEAREELGLHLPSGGIVHALQGDSWKGGKCVKKKKGPQMYLCEVPQFSL